MATIKLWARNGDAVRQAIELGELVHLDTASEELTDEFLLFAIQSGLLSKWAAAFPDPRCEPEISMEVLLASHVAARLAGLYSMRKSGYVLRSAAVLGALGYSIEVLEPERGLSWRGTSDDKRISGDVLRKLLVQFEQHVDLNEPLRMPPCEPSQSVKVRKRASRRAVKGEVDVAEAEARAQRVAAQLMAWDNDTVGPSLLAYARVGQGRRIHIVDTTRVEVPLETGTYECSGVVKNDDGSRSRGYKLATLRTFLDHAGLITQGGLAPIQVHDLPLCRLFFETASVLRKGDLLLEDRGFVDGETVTVLKQQRHVDVIVPLKSTMLSYKEAVQLADLQDTWQPHPSRDHQHIAFVQGVEHLWEACQGPLNACVIRYGNRKKAALDHIVLVTTDQRLTGPWIVRHYEERPEIEQDYEQMKSGGWQLKKLSSTRYSEIVFYLLTVVLSYRLYHLFANTQAGTHFADKTRQALAFDQLRSRRTHVIAYAGGYFEIFETLSFARFILQLPATAQERLRHWLDAHLHMVQQRE
jgi:hypothetical protein